MLQDPAERLLGPGSPIGELARGAVALRPLGAGQLPDESVDPCALLRRGAQAPQVGGDGLPVASDPRHLEQLLLGIPLRDREAREDKKRRADPSNESTMEE